MGGWVVRGVKGVLARRGLGRQRLGAVHACAAKGCAGSMPRGASHHTLPCLLLQPPLCRHRNSARATPLPAPLMQLHISLLHPGVALHRPRGASPVGAGRHAPGRCAACAPQSSTESASPPPAARSESRPGKSQTDPAGQRHSRLGGGRLRKRQTRTPGAWGPKGRQDAGLAWRV